jgi:hypothetical protein
VRPAAQALATSTRRTIPKGALAALSTAPRMPAWLGLAVSILGYLGATEFAEFAESPDQARAIADFLEQRARCLPAEFDGLARMQVDHVGRRVGQEGAELVVGLLGASYSALSVEDLTDLLQGTVDDPRFVATTVRDMLDEQLWEADTEGGLRPAHLPLMDTWQSYANPAVRSMLAKAALAKGIQDAAHAIQLLATIALAAPFEGEHHALASALNHLSADESAPVILALSVAPGTRIFELISGLDARSLNRNGRRALKIAPGINFSDVWTDGGPDVPDVVRRRLKDASRGLRRHPRASTSCQDT